MSFPPSPSNGELYTTALGTQYIYVSADTAWKVNGSGAGSGTVKGTGVANRVAKWTDSSTIGTGLMSEDGTFVTVGRDTTVQDLGINIKNNYGYPGSGRVGFVGVDDAGTPMVTGEVKSNLVLSNYADSIGNVTIAPLVGNTSPVLFEVSGGHPTIYGTQGSVNVFPTEGGMYPLVTIDCTNRNMTLGDTHENPQGLLTINGYRSDSNWNPGKFLNQIAVNIGVNDATETFGDSKYNSGFDYPLRQGGFTRGQDPLPVFTREDHGLLDASGYLQIVGVAVPRESIDNPALAYQKNYNGTGYVVISNGRNHDNDPDWQAIRASVEFSFDTLYQGLAPYSDGSGARHSDQVFLRDTGFYNDIFATDDERGYFCITIPGFENDYPRRALTLINNTPYQMDVGYWVKYTEDTDPYTYLGWLYD